MQLEGSMTKDLETQLSPEEIDERKEQLAVAVKELEGLKEEQKKVQKFWAGKVNDLETRIRRLATSATTGKESRPVLCHERPDLRRFVIEIVRRDTGAVIDTKAMSQDQLEEARQANLFGAGGVRVATEKKGLDLASPPAATTTAPEAPASNGAPPDDAATITNPEGLLNGEEAKKGRKRKKPAGLNVSTAADIAKAHDADAAADAAPAAPGAVPFPDHWPDCQLNHGGPACDMGADCGKSDEQIDRELAAKQAATAAEHGDPPPAEPEQETEGDS